MCIGFMFYWRTLPVRRGYYRLRRLVRSLMNFNYVIARIKHLIRSRRTYLIVI
jgi:hypothetical protein